MTHDEAKKTSCPLQSPIVHSAPYGPIAARNTSCKADACNWWLKDGPDDGECAIRRVARMLTEPTVMLIKDLHLPKLKMVGGLVETEDD